MPTVAITLKIDQQLQSNKLAKAELELFEQALMDPDFEVTSDFLNDKCNAAITASVGDVSIDNKKALSARRSVEVEVKLDSNKKLAKFLSDEGVMEEDFSEFSALKFAKYFLGSWEGIYIGDEMVDFESKVSLVDLVKG